MKPSSSKSIKIENVRLVMQQLIDLRETSRVELAKATTLTKKTVSSIVNELVLKNLVIETNRSVKTSGRSAKVIALNKNAGRIISIELLTTSIYGIISNIYGEILYEVRREVNESDFPPYLKVLLETIDELRDNTYVSTYGLIGIGIAVYGILSKSKKIKFAPFVSWKDINLKSIIEEYVGVKSFIENEANISAIGESLQFPQYDNILTINVGIGVGMGIIINGKLYTGEDGFAGEIGHTTVVPNGKACVCGNYGCLERYISDTAVMETYYELTNKHITMNEFIELYKAKDSAALTIYQDFIAKLSVAVSNIAHLFNPKMLIISSQIVEGIPESISLIKNNLRSQIMSLDLLTVSKHQSKTNVLGLTQVIIQDFLSSEDHVS